MASGGLRFVVIEFVQLVEDCGEQLFVDALDFPLVDDEVSEGVGGVVTATATQHLSGLLERVGGREQLAELPQVLLNLGTERVVSLERIVHIDVASVGEPAEVVVFVSVAEVAEAPIPTAVPRRLADEDDPTIALADAERDLFVAVDRFHLEPLAL